MEARLNFLLKTIYHKTGFSEYINKNTFIINTWAQCFISIQTIAMFLEK